MGAAVESEADIAHPVARLRGRLSTDLRAALKARDPIRTAAIRATMSALDNAEAVPAVDRTVEPKLGPGSADVPRRHVDERTVMSIVDREIETREQAASEYRDLGRTDAAERLDAEAAVLRTYRRA